ncbi:aspartate kinase [Oceanirhabdus seepicola]|uniref:Aspartokinase n=1 Tax=Oceanirhabdus seepicola TaxID=2828781 RepID=A0A9J6P552_9CLOT|nr:aspartate kinase [Oceanirhabdus seepicola]MCM1991699.1 aspartate kinase [Oceanirhabdus seepicola]
MAVLVQKYGGTSVGSIDKIKNIARRVIADKEKGNDMVIVVSAMGKSTDKLVEMAKAISENPCNREMDMLLSTGEQITISLLSMALKEYGYDSISLTGFQAGIITEGDHTKNRIAEIEIENIKNHLKNGKIVVVAGFQGINENGDITTLGRGGSDTTAVALAARLKCQCEIYTDVDGIYSVDPRVFPEAKKLEVVSYEEMMEMASLGAGVMETRAVEIGFKYKVPIYVALNTGEVIGTYIKEHEKVMEEKVITGLAATEDVLMITINNVEYNSKNIALIFKKLAKYNVNIDMISQTAPFNGVVNVSFTASKNDIFAIDKVVKKLKNELKNIEVSKDSNISKISVVGIGMMNQSGVAGKVFKIFSDNNIEFKQVTTSEISISYTIDAEDKIKAITVLAKELDL